MERIRYSAVPIFIDALNDSDAWVRGQAAGMLIRCGQAETLVKIGEAAVPALIDALRTEGGSWVSYPRDNAIWSLSKIGEPAVPKLVTALKDSNWGVRSGAAQALERIGDNAVPALVSTLKDSDWQVRVLVASLLRKIRNKSAVPALIDALKDDDERVRCMIAWALEEIGGVSALEAAECEYHSHSDRCFCRSRHRVSWKLRCASP
ncbi:MAG: HEAT repeat domain-containing protein [Blastocatellia bacterium]